MFLKKITTQGKFSCLVLQCDPLNGMVENTFVMEWFRNWTINSCDTSGWEEVFHPVSTTPIYSWYRQRFHSEAFTIQWTEWSTSIFYANKMIVLRMTYESSFQQCYSYLNWSEPWWERIPRDSSSIAIEAGAVRQFLAVLTNTLPILINALFSSLLMLNRYVEVPSRNMISAKAMIIQGIPNPRPQLRLSWM